MSFPPPDPSRPANSDFSPPGGAPLPPPAAPTPAAGPDAPTGEGSPAAPEPPAGTGTTESSGTDNTEDSTAADDPLDAGSDGNSAVDPADPADGADPASATDGMDPAGPGDPGGTDESTEFGAATEASNAHEPEAGATEEADPAVDADSPAARPGDTTEVLTPDAVIGDPAGTPDRDPPVERVAPSEPVMQPASTLPAATKSRALVPIPKAADEPTAPRGLGRRWSLPAWAWLAIGTVVVAAGVAAVITRPDDDTKEVATLQAEVAAKDAELVQVQVQAQQEAFNDVQEVRDEAEKQLSAAADAREQAEAAAELSDSRYTALIAYQVTQAQAAANEAACKEADAAGYAQAAKPDPAKYAPAAVADLPGDTRAAVLARLDTDAITTQVDDCFEVGSNRYLSQTTTTTTTTAPPPPPVDPNAPPAG